MSEPPRSGLGIQAMPSLKRPSLMDETSFRTSSHENSLLLTRRMSIRGSECSLLLKRRSSLQMGVPMLLLAASDSDLAPTSPQSASSLSRKDSMRWSSWRQSSVHEIIEITPGISKVMCFMTLLMSVVGAGMLSLPYALMSVGFIAGGLTLAATAAAMCFTAELLLDCHIATGLSSYAEFAEHAFGNRRGLAALTTANSLLAIFGGCVSYITILNDALPFTLRLIFPAVDTIPNMVITSVAFTVCVLPLCVFEHIESLKYTSVIGLCFSVILAVFIVFSGVSVLVGTEELDWHFLFWGMDHPGMHEITAGSFAQSSTAASVEGSSVFKLATAASIFNFAFVLHLNIIPLYQGMGGDSHFYDEDQEDEIDYDHEKRILQDRVSMKSVIRGVVATSVVTYMVVGCMGVISYQQQTLGNVLLNLQKGVKSHPVLIIPQVANVIVVVLAFPLLFFPLRELFSALVFGEKDTDSDEGGMKTKKFVLTVFLNVVVFVTAHVLPGLQVVFSLTGATSIVAMCLVFPAMFSIHLVPQSAWRCGTAVAVSLLATVVGVVATVATISKLV